MYIYEYPALIITGECGIFLCPNPTDFTTPTRLIFILKAKKKVEMYGIEIPISTYRTQGAITFKVLSLKHTEISASQYFLYYKKMHYSASLHFILYLYTDLVFGFACVLYCSDPFKLYFKSLYGGVYNTLCHSCRIYLKHFFCNLRYSVLRHIV